MNVHDLCNTRRRCLIKSGAKTTQHQRYNGRNGQIPVTFTRGLNRKKARGLGPNDEGEVTPGKTKCELVPFQSFSIMNLT
jgi:hypothetical protein